MVKYYYNTSRSVFDWSSIGSRSVFDLSLIHISEPTRPY